MSIDSLPPSERGHPDPGRMVFVGGLHRSGTTPLGRVIAAHPHISGLVGTGVWEDEGQHLQDVYPPASRYGGPGRFALAPAAHLTEESPLVTSTTAQRLLASWDRYWSDRSAPLLVEKSPPNMIMGRFLQAVFPGSALVVVLRHPVVVALSTVKWRRLLSSHWWNHVSIHDMVRHWFAAAELLAADAPYVSRLHVLYYEDLLADPRRELAALQDFLGLDVPFAADLWRPGHSRPYEERWDSFTRTPWGRRLRTAVVSDFAQAAERFGYDIEDLTRSTTTQFGSERDVARPRPSPGP